MLEEKKGKYVFKTEQRFLQTENKKVPRNRDKQERQMFKGEQKLKVSK